jgi:hypothetical protein
MEISKKKLLAITLTLATFLAMFAVLGPVVVSTEFIDLDDYCWIEGVLHSDTYTLYPYAQESLDIGFSKYGEMIGYNEDTEIGLGMQYPGYTGAADPDLAPDGTYDQTIGTSVDPFCNEEIGVDWWMNGWFIDIKYTPLGAADREIWAFALFSDGALHGGDWIVMPSVAADSAARPLWQEHPPYANPDSTLYSGVIDPIPESGGRKTNGYCETEPIEIIYNGPRRFIAICRTKISDVGEGAALVDLTFTFIFNKAEKNVIILKDIKRLYKKSPMNIQFGNRGEWDLGISPDTDSYIHWYTDEPVQFWDLNGLGTITAEEEEKSFEFFKDYFLSYKYPKKWWDEVPSSEIPTTVCDEWTLEMIDFPGGRYCDEPSWNETQETCYGREWHMDATIKEHSYAVAQVISMAGDYVGALAVWPHPEFWAAHNKYYPPLRTTLAGGGDNPASLTLMLKPISRMLEWNKWLVVEDPTSDDFPNGALEDRSDVWVKMDDVVSATGTTKEPIIPFTIYEHDFELSSTLPAYRMVSVYMLTDRHDADDVDARRTPNTEPWSDGINQIDREIQYQLDEIFDPWDIYDAMHKNTKRWVEFFDVGVDAPDTPWTSPNMKAWDGETYYCIELDSEREIESGLLIPSLPVYPGTEPGVRPGDWDGDHGLCWDAYCAETERVLVDTGSGYELVPRAVGGPILSKPANYKPSSLTSYNFLDPTPSKTRHYYTINLITGRICFYEWNSDTEVFEPWCLPEDSLVKVLWSSEHHATTAEQWDEDDLLYPIDGSTFRFPLHHDIMPQYKDLTEVFLVEQPPERLDVTTDYTVTPSTQQIVTDEILTSTPGTYPPGTEFILANEFVSCYYAITVEVDGVALTYGTDYSRTYHIVDDFDYKAKITLLTQQTPSVNITASYRYYTRAKITLVNPSDNWWCKELDVKYHMPDLFYCEYPLEFIEEKFHIDLVEKASPDSLEVRTAYNLSYPMDFVEKVWIHSEKALLGGDYVFNQPTKTLYMQDPVPACQWLLVNYTVGGVSYANFFHGDGSTTDFELEAYPDLNSLVVNNTEIQQQIINVSDPDPPDPLGIRVPREDCYWRATDGGDYQGIIWERFGIWEEREWLVVTDTKVRGNWIIRESPEGDYFSTCDELVLDQAPLDAFWVNWPYIRSGWPGQELKIVFKVPSGRWEWANIGKISAPEDSLGNTMVVAAFKNKLIEFGLGSLDWQSTWGPRIPWLTREDISPDTLGRYHLHDDWCYSRIADAGAMDTSWPISSSNIISVGGSAVNDVTEYFNDFLQALDGTTVTGTHGRAGIYAVTCWDKALDEYGFYEFPAAVTDRYGYAIIATYKDKNGTIGFIVEGWSSQDTYYATKWFDEHKFELQHINLHVTDLILEIEYKDSDGDLYCHPLVDILEKLGTISEKPQHDC